MIFNAWYIFYDDATGVVPSIFDWLNQDTRTNSNIRVVSGAGAGVSSGHGVTADSRFAFAPFHVTIT